MNMLADNYCNPSTLIYITLTRYVLQVEWNLMKAFNRILSYTFSNWLEPDFKRLLTKYIQKQAWVM